MEPTTATAIMTDQRNRRLEYAMCRLLDRLRDYVRVYPMMQDAEMPEHDVAWVTEIDKGPGHVVLEAMKATPELWLQAMPEGICLVSLNALEQAGMTPDVIDYLKLAGENIVTAKASQTVYETEARERDARYSAVK